MLGEETAPVVQQATVGVLEHVGLHSPSAGIVAQGEVADGISGGKREGGTRAGADGVPGQTAHDAFAEEAADQAAEELSSVTFHGLGRETGPGGGDEVADVTTIKGVAVSLADAVDHLHLDRDHRHGGQGLGQQLKRSGQNRVVENTLFQRRRVDDHTGGGRGRGGGGCCGHRSRRGHGQRGDEGLRGAVGLVSRFGRELQGLAQVLEETTFGGIGGTVRVADSHSHLVGQQPRLRTRQIGGRGGYGDPTAQNILVERPRIEGVRGEPFGDPLEGGPLRVGLGPICESGMEQEGEDSALFGGREHKGTTVPTMPPSRHYAFRVRFNPVLGKTSRPAPKPRQHDPPVPIRTDCAMSTNRPVPYLGPGDPGGIGGGESGGSRNPPVPNFAGPFSQGGNPPVPYWWGWLVRVANVAIVARWLVSC